MCTFKTVDITSTRLSWKHSGKKVTEVLVVTIKVSTI